MREKQRQFNNWENGPDFDRARTQIATPFQYIDIALDVLTVNKIFNISGDFLYLDASSTGVVTLELNNQYNDASAPFLASPGFGLNALFKQVKFSWVAQPGKKVRVMYSTGDRVVPTNSTTINGYVNTVDGGLSRTLANQAFLGYGYCGVVAAQSAQVQLWNPSGSGKNIILESVSFSSNNASAIYLGGFNAALPTSAGSIKNKNEGSAAGVALIKKTNDAVIQMSGGDLLYLVSALAVTVVNFREPKILPPGYGFVVSSAAGFDLTANFEFYEA